MTGLKSQDTVWKLAQTNPVTLPSVSAVVVCYFTGSPLKDCLFSLLADPQVDEIVIVNNGNKPRDLGFLNRFADAQKQRVKLITGHGNVGFAAGANLGARASRGERILFINPDAILRRGSIAAFEDAAIGLKEPWIVGGRVFDEHGKEQRGGRRRILRMTSAFVTFTGLSLFEPLHSMFEDFNRLRDNQPDGPVPMPVVSGALMYMSRQGFERLQGFDEDYFLHVEDIDICRRAGEVLGGDVAYTPLAGALHYGGTSDVPSWKVEWQKAKGLGLYFRKHASSRREKTLAFIMTPAFTCILLCRLGLRAAPGVLFRALLSLFGVQRGRPGSAQGAGVSIVSSRFFGLSRKRFLLQRSGSTTTATSSEGSLLE